MKVVFVKGVPGAVLETPLSIHRSMYGLSGVHCGKGPTVLFQTLHRSLTHAHTHMHTCVHIHNAEGRMP